MNTLYIGLKIFRAVGGKMFVKIKQGYTVDPEKLTDVVCVSCSRRISVIRFKITSSTMPDDDCVSCAGCLQPPLSSTAQLNPAP